MTSYPEGGTRLNVPANMLFSIVSGFGVPAGPSAWALVPEMNVWKLRVLTPGVSETEVFDAQPFIGGIYRYFQDVWTQKTQSGVLCLIPDQPYCIAASPTIAKAWIGELRTAAMQAAPAVQAPSSEDQTDQGQNTQLAPVGFTQHATDQYRIIPGVKFDSVALLYGGNRPQGVKILGMRRDMFGTILVFDGPASPGAPVPSQEISERVIVPLLDRAEEMDGEGVLVELSTGSVYAATLPTLLALVARQALPEPEKPAFLEQMVTHVHPILQEAATHARAWSMAPDSFRRSIAAILCVLSAGLTFAFLSLWVVMGVEPVYQLIIRWPFGAAMDTPTYRMSVWLIVTTVTFTIARLLAWMPSFIEFAGVMFGDFKWVAKVGIGVAVVDIIANAVFYYPTMLPETINTYGTGTRIAMRIAVAFGAMIVGPFTALGWEVMTVVSLVMTIALLPSLAWAVGAIYRGIAVNFLRGRYRLFVINQELRDLAADLSPTQGGRVIYTQPSGAFGSGQYRATARRSNWGALVVICLVLMLLVGMYIWLVRAPGRGV